MATLFAARDLEGVTRYIGDVPRGHACGCYCLSCGSPLVAKQGEEKEWHFAHEAGQERPECPAGVANLLRRLAVTEFIALGLWVDVPYSVPNPWPGGPPLSWTAQRIGPIVQAESEGADEAAAWVPLENSMTAGLHDCIGKETLPPRHSPEGDGEAVAQLVLHVSMPDESGIRNEADARTFLRRNMRLNWGYLPDWQGVLQRATVSAQEEATRRRMQLAAIEAESARHAGMRWAARRQVAFGRSPDRGETDESFESLAAPRPPMPVPPPAAAPAWAPGLTEGGSIQYRELDDDTRWISYPASNMEVSRPLLARISVSYLLFGSSGSTATSIRGHPLG